MVDQELVKSLRTAIEVENNGLISFLKFARSTKDLTGKNMFIRLAMDEHEHRLILEKQLNNLLDGGEWQNIEIPPSEVEQLLPKLRDKQKQIKGESGMAELDALQTAIDLEKKAASFFREEAAKATNPEVKKMFNRLAEWEDSHYDLIQAELDYINNTGFWMGIPEFRMDGKF